MKKSTLILSACLAASASFISTLSIAAEHEQEKMAADLYIYGYTPVIMELTKRIGSNIEKAEPNGHAPVNQFGHVRQLPDSTFTDVVAVNVDTLYSSAFLDVSKEPVILSVPDTQGRYYLMPMMDKFSNVFASPGARTTGTKKGNFAIVAANWQGELPKGVEKIVAPTPEVWIIGRTAIKNKSELAEVNHIQDQYQLTPLSHWGKKYEPALAVVNKAWDMKTPPMIQMENMDVATFYTALHEVLKMNPPLKQDAAFVKEISSLGFLGAKFDWNKLSAEEKATFSKGFDAGKAELLAAGKGFGAKGKEVNNWGYNLDAGDWGTDYLYRSVIAKRGLGNNIPADAVYYNTFKDANGEKLNGANQYVLHFNKGETAPSNAFWSITMYTDQRYFSTNEINRVALGDRDQYTVNTDGSIDFYLQHTRPAEDKVANWLPAPAGDFSLSHRVYWPKEAVLT